MRLALLFIFLWFCPFVCLCSFFQLISLKVTFYYLVSTYFWSSKYSTMYLSILLKLFKRIWFYTKLIIQQRLSFSTFGYCSNTRKKNIYKTLRLQKRLGRSIFCSFVLFAFLPIKSSLFMLIFAVYLFKCVFTTVRGLICLIPSHSQYGRPM